MTFPNVESTFQLFMNPMVRHCSGERFFSLLKYKELTADKNITRKAVCTKHHVHRNLQTSYEDIINDFDIKKFNILIKLLCKHVMIAL